MFVFNLDVYTESEVNPEDILKLESQERESVLFDQQIEDVSEDEENELYEDYESINLSDGNTQGVDRRVDDEDGNETDDIMAKETDNSVLNVTSSKAKNTKKPKRAEYKVIR